MGRRREERFRHPSRARRQPREDRARVARSQTPGPDGDRRAPEGAQRQERAWRGPERRHLKRRRGHRGQRGHGNRHEALQRDQERAGGRRHAVAFLQEKNPHGESHAKGIGRVHGLSREHHGREAEERDPRSRAPQEDPRGKEGEREGRRRKPEDHDPIPRAETGEDRGGFHAAQGPERTGGGQQQESPPDPSPSPAPVRSRPAHGGAPIRRPAPGAG